MLLCGLEVAVNAVELSECKYRAVLADELAADVAAAAEAYAALHLEGKIV